VSPGRVDTQLASHPGPDGAVTTVEGEATVETVQQEAKDGTVADGDISPTLNALRTLGDGFDPLELGLLRGLESDPLSLLEGGTDGVDLDVSTLVGHVASGGSDVGNFGLSHLLFEVKVKGRGGERESHPLNPYELSIAPFRVKRQGARGTGNRTEAVRVTAPPSEALASGCEGVGPDAACGGRFGPTSLGDGLRGDPSDAVGSGLGRRRGRCSEASAHGGVGVESGLLRGDCEALSTIGSASSASSGFESRGEGTAHSGFLLN
jgi:hypothetical protein